LSCISCGQLIYTVYAAFFLSAYLAFIIADNFFLKAALIGLRPVDFLETAVAFLDLASPFRFAHQAFFAAPILAREDNTATTVLTLLPQSVSQLTL
jgi:hypothetical protein